MSSDQSGSRISRRRALKKAALATGAVWTAPLLQSMMAPAYAQVSPGPCDPNCSHGVHLTRNPDGSYSCQEPPGFESCTGTPGSCPGCVRIVSAHEIAPGQIRVCLNCRPIQVVFCCACPDICICSEGSPDVNNCVELSCVSPDCFAEDFDFYFRCLCP
jgi:hypothetical protein